MALPQTSPRLTEAEYLDIERSAELKSEFYDGEMFAMAAGTLARSRITTNLTREVGNRLGQGRCLPFNADLRIKVVATGLFTYPDLSVICGPPEFVDDHPDTIVNPTVLIEVLSDSTEAYDRGKKFEHYRQIPTLKEYLLVSQREPRIEQFVRQSDDRWFLKEAAGMDTSLELPSLKISISLGEVFANVQFTPGPIRRQTARI